MAGAASKEAKSLAKRTRSPPSPLGLARHFRDNATSRGHPIRAACSIQRQPATAGSNGHRRLESHRFPRSNVPILPPTFPEQRFRPVSAQYQPLAPNSNRQLFVRSRASATPHQWRWHTEPLDAFQDRCEQLPRRAPRLSLWPAFVVTDQRPASLRGGAFCDR